MLLQLTTDRLFPGGYPLPEMELYLLLWVHKEWSDGTKWWTLIYELRLLVEFSEISFALMLATLATYYYSAQLTGQDYY